MLAVNILAALIAAGLVAWFANRGYEAWRIKRRVRRRMDTFANLDLDDMFIKPVLAFEEQVIGAAKPVSVLVTALNQLYALSGGVRTGMMALGTALVVGVGMLSLLQFFGVPPWFALPAGIGLGILAGWSVGAAREDARRNLFGSRLLGAVEEFHRLSRHGMATGQAFDSMVGLSEEPLRGALRRVQTSAGLGVPLAVALGREGQRLRISELSMLAAIFATQSRTGGGVTESVGNLAEMLRERQDNRSRMKAAAAEPKITLYIVSAVPFAAVGIQMLNNPEIIDLLLGPARFLLGIGGGMIILGLVVAWLIVRSVSR